MSEPLSPGSNESQPTFHPLIKGSFRSHITHNSELKSGSSRFATIVTPNQLGFILRSDRTANSRCTWEAEKLIDDVLSDVPICACYEDEIFR